MRMDAQTAKEKIRVVPERSGKCSVGDACGIPGWNRWQGAFQSNSQVEILVQCCDEWTGLTALWHGQSSHVAHRFEQFHTSFKYQIKP